MRRHASCKLCGHALTGHRFSPEIDHDAASPCHRALLYKIGVFVRSKVDRNRICLYTDISNESYFTILLPERDVLTYPPLLRYFAPVRYGSGVIF